MAKDFIGAEIVAGKWAIFATAYNRSPELEWRYIHKVEGNQVWTKVGDREDFRASKVRINSKLLMMDKPEEVL